MLQWFLWMEGPDWSDRWCYSASNQWFFSCTSRHNQPMFISRLSPIHAAMAKITLAWDTDPISFLRTVAPREARSEKTDTIHHSHQCLHLHWYFCRQPRPGIYMQVSLRENVCEEQWYRRGIRYSRRACSFSSLISLTIHHLIHSPPRPIVLHYL